MRMVKWSGRRLRVMGKRLRRRVEIERGFCAWGAGFPCLSLAAHPDESRDSAVVERPNSAASLAGRIVSPLMRVKVPKSSPFALPEWGVPFGTSLLSIPRIDNQRRLCVHAIPNTSILTACPLQARGGISSVWRTGVRALECVRGTTRHWSFGDAASFAAQGTRRPRRAANGIMHPGAPLTLSPRTDAGLCGPRVSQTSPPAAFGGMGLGRGPRMDEPT